MKKRPTNNRGVRTKKSPEKQNAKDIYNKSKIFPNNILNNIKSKFILGAIFKNINTKTSLELIRYNKTLQSKLNKSINDYKNECKIIIELIPNPNCISVNNDNNIFINYLDEEYKPYYHIYFDDNKEEIQRNYLNKKDNVSKIIIVIDGEIISFKNLFNNCICIEKINFIKFSRKNIFDMSYMFYNCSSLKELNNSNFNTSNVTNMTYMFGGCINLREINLFKFNTSKVTNMKSMGVKV